MPSREKKRAVDDADLSGPGTASPLVNSFDRPDGDGPLVQLVIAMTLVCRGRCL